MAPLLTESPPVLPDTLATFREFGGREVHFTPGALQRERAQYERCAPPAQERPDVSQKNLVCPFVAPFLRTDSCHEYSLKRVSLKLNRQNRTTQWS
jgi:hypothetical protein